MIGPITSVIQTEPTTATQRASSPKSATSKPASSTGQTDTVQLSGAAQALLAALQEATESPAQTAKEAGAGDPQAQKLLAKAAAAHPAK